jgi:hypothetical protein
VLKSSADGTSAIPAVTQTAGTTWEITLATFTRATNGTITLTDARDFLHLGQVLVWKRLGGDATNWATQGSTTYTPGPMRFQCGAAQLTFSSSATSNLITIPFPTSYSGTPLVLLTVFSNGSGTGRKIVASVETISTTQVQIRGFLCDNSTTSSSFDVYWLAIGPK